MAVLGLLVQAAGDLDEWPRYCRFGTAEHTKDLGHLARPATRPLGFAWDRVALEWEEPVCAEKAEWEEEEDVAPALLFRGTMLYFGDEGRHRPIDWHQGLRLLVARHPGCELDWDNGHAENLSTWSDGILGDDGRFELYLPLSEIYRASEISASFQIGLVPAAMDGTNATWKTSAPVLAGSVAFQTIAGHAALSLSAQKISAVGRLKGQTFQPRCAVAAVNHLQSLGRDAALRELDLYLRLATARFFVAEPPDPANPDQAFGESVFPLVWLLFAPPAGGSRPFIGLGGPSPEPPKAVLAELPTFPLVVVRDVPFLLVEGYYGTGTRPDPRKQIEWARQSGVWREQPMHPADDPAAALQELLDKLSSIDVQYAARVQPLLLSQLRSAVGSLTPPPKQAGGFSRPAGSLRWDELEQAWVAVD